MDGSSLVCPLVPLSTSAPNQNLCFKVSGKYVLQNSEEFLGYSGPLQVRILFCIKVLSVTYVTSRNSCLIKLV